MDAMNGSVFWQVVGWLAFALNVWGNLALTTKGLRGWVIRIGSNACWIPYGIVTGAWALTANHALFIAINCYGWWKWRRDEVWRRRVDTPGETPPATEAEISRRIAFARQFDAAPREHGDGREGRDGR